MYLSLPQPKSSAGWYDFLESRRAPLAVRLCKNALGNNIVMLSTQTHYTYKQVSLFLFQLVMF